MAVAPQDRHHVGEVLLALGVVGGHSLDRVGEQVTVERVHPGVDLVDRALLRRRVHFLDDLADRPPVIKNDPAVSGRVRHPRGERGHRVLVRLVHADQVRQRLAAQQRRIAVGHHHDAADLAHRFQRGADRVARPLLPGLDDHARIRRVLGDVRDHLVPALARHHDEAVRVQVADDREHVPQHAATAHGVQHLRGTGLHPPALARGEDDHGCGADSTHSCGLLGWLVTRNRGDRTRVNVPDSRRIPPGCRVSWTVAQTAADPGQARTSRSRFRHTRPIALEHAFYRRASPA